MRSVTWSGRPGVFRILLLGRREGSASAFRVLCLREGAQDVVDVAQDVGIHILFGQRQRLESRICLAQHLKSVLHRNHRVGSCELVGAAEAVLVPDQHVVIDYECLHLSRLIGNQAHACLELPDLPGADLLPSSFDTREDDVPKHGDPVHALGRQILNRAITVNA